MEEVDDPSDSATTSLLGMRMFSGAFSSRANADRVLAAIVSQLGDHGVTGLEVVVVEGATPGYPSGSLWRPDWSAATAEATDPWCPERDRLRNVAVFAKRRDIAGAEFQRLAPKTKALGLPTLSRPTPLAAFERREGPGRKLRIRPKRSGVLWTVALTIVLLAGLATGSGRWGPLWGVAIAAGSLVVATGVFFAWNLGGRERLRGLEMGYLTQHPRAFVLLLWVFGALEFALGAGLARAQREVALEQWVGTVAMLAFVAGATFALDRAFWHGGLGRWRVAVIPLVGALVALPIKAAYEGAFAAGLGVPANSVRLPLLVLMRAVAPYWAFSALVLIIGLLIWVVASRESVFQALTLAILCALMGFLALLNSAQQAIEAGHQLAAGHVLDRWEGVTQCVHLSRPDTEASERPNGTYLSLVDESGRGVLVGPTQGGRLRPDGAVWWGEVTDGPMRVARGANGCS